MKNFEEFFKESLSYTNELLDKISDQGYTSLSPEEKEYLSAYSKDSKDKNFNISNEIEDRIFGRVKKEFKFDSDDSNDENQEDVIDQDVIIKKLEKMTSELSMLITQEVAPDIKGDNHAIDYFLKNILLTISKIQKNNFEEALEFLNKTKQNFNPKEYFCQKYQNLEWYSDITTYIEGLEETLNETL